MGSSSKDTRHLIWSSWTQGMRSGGFLVDSVEGRQTGEKWVGRQQYFLVGSWAREVGFDLNPQPEIGCDSSGGRQPLKDSEQEKSLGCFLPPSFLAPLTSTHPIHQKPACLPRHYSSAVQGPSLLNKQPWTLSDFIDCEQVRT